MRKRKFAVIAVLAVTLLFGVACTSSQIRKAEVTVRDFAVALQQFESAVTTAHQAGYISDADYKAIEAQVERMADFGKQAVTALRVTKSKPDAITAIDAALASTDQLLAQNDLAIKNPATKTSISALILSLRGVLVTAKALLS